MGVIAMFAGDGLPATHNLTAVLQNKRLEVARHARKLMCNVA